MECVGPYAGNVWSLPPFPFVEKGRMQKAPEAETPLRRNNPCQRRTMLVASSEPSSSLQFHNTNTKKRKDAVLLEDFCHDFPSIPIPIPPSSKSRRLEAELCTMMEEEEVNQDPPSSSEEANNERAVVLYHHPNNASTPFAKSPSSTDFSIIVKADLIPGLKDYLISWGIAKPDNSVEDEVRREKSSEVSSDRLAVVPWAAFHSPMASEEIVPETGQPLEAKQGEMMELDEPYVNNNNMEIGEMVETAGASSLWQQHCMMLNHLQNTSTPIHWCYHS